ncbi:hypothetical protein ABZ570_24685 [Micromonospora sp. NPDC007271]|uniref:hypothetical protein n=1 Tax=Micromonospora sp. NPDC007271 TaxID=3154587 RepID=UPI0034093EA3
MTLPLAACREEVLAILVEIGYRTPDSARERIDSLELARLLYELERRYGVQLALDDDELLAMSTLTGAAEVLQRVRERGRTGDPG